MAYKFAGSILAAFFCLFVVCSEASAAIHREASISIPWGYVVQGFCYNSSSHRFLMAAKTPQDTGPEARQIIMVIHPDTFKREQTYLFHDLGHINTMTYQPEENAIYIATGGAKWHEYAKVDARSMKVLEKKTCPKDFGAMAYDTARKEYVQYSLRKGTYDISRYDKNMRPKKGLIVKTVYNVGNGLTAHDGTLLMFTLPLKGKEYGGLEVIDRKGNIVTSLQIPREIELEDADYVNGKFYMAANDWKERKAAIYTYEP